MIIDLAKDSEAEEFFAHLHRQAEQNGVGSSPIYMTMEKDEFKVDCSKLREVWAKPTQELGWQRNWFIKDNNRIVGNIQLNGAKMHSAKHRVTLSMGIEENYRGSGSGTRLMETALGWAKRNNFSWVDLGVFENNQTAVKLYLKFGFEKAAQYSDKFRFRGQSIDEIKMALNLKNFS